jgi:hypothetical protein
MSSPHFFFHTQKKTEYDSISDNQHIRSDNQHHTGMRTGPTDNQHTGPTDNQHHTGFAHTKKRAVFGCNKHMINRLKCITHACMHTYISPGAVGATSPSHEKEEGDLGRNAGGHQPKCAPSHEQVMPCIPPMPCIPERFSYAERFS